MLGRGKPSTWSTGDTYFHFDHSGFGFLMTDGANARPRSLTGFGTYRTQPAVTGGWAPTAHEWDILVNGATDIEIDRIHLHNATKGIGVVGHATHGANGRIFISRITGQPFTNGILMTHCTDAVYLDDIHLWPFFSISDDAYTYTRANGIAFAFGKVDNAKIGRMFSYGYSRGLYFYHQGASGSLPTGTSSLFAANAIGCDNSGIVLVTDADSDGVTANISHLYGGSITDDPSISTEPMIQLLGDNSDINVTNFYAYNSNESAVQMNGTGNVLTIGVAKSVNMDADANGSPDFYVTSGNRLRLLAAPETSASSKYSITGTGIIETPDWIAYTPTLSVGSGAFTTASATGRYRRIGSTVDVLIIVTITTNGTAGGYVRSTLPFTAAQGAIMPGREIAATGIGLHATTAGAQSTCDILIAHTNGYPGGSGYVLEISGKYEV